MGLMSPCLRNSQTVRGSRGLQGEDGGWESQEAKALGIHRYSEDVSLQSERNAGVTVFPDG
jgi:hypothetical protein